MTRRLFMIVLIAALVLAAASGWYMYRQDHQRLVALQNGQLLQQKAIEAVAKDYKIGIFLGAQDMTVRYQIPRQIATSSGMAIVYDEFVSNITKYTEIQRLTATGSYTPTTLSDIKVNENIVVIIGPDGAIARLYAITR